LGRTWLIALAAVILLASVVGAGSYVNAQNQSRIVAQETQTAQARLTETAGAPTATPLATQGTTTPGTTVTAAPSATALPTGVGVLVFDSPAPTCDSSDPVVWKAGNGATAHCPGGSQVDLSAATQGTLACLSAQNESQANGYIAATVGPQSGNVVLGFRQGTGDITSSGFNITGYYLAVNAQQSQYVLYKVDHAGAITQLAQGALAAQPPSTFQMAALFNGTTLTPFVNGQALPSAHDAAFQNGWVAACTDGSTAFSHVQLYTATQ
jgi:hypothetical protein